MFVFNLFSGGVGFVFFVIFYVIELNYFFNIFEILFFNVEFELNL